MGKAVVVGVIDDGTGRNYRATLMRDVSEYEIAVQGLEKAITATNLAIIEMESALSVEKEACDAAKEKLVPSYGTADGCFVAAQLGIHSVTIESDLGDIPIKVLTEEEYAEVNPTESTCPEVKPGLFLTIPSMPDELDACYRYAELAQQKSILMNKLAMLYSQLDKAKSGAARSGITLDVKYAGAWPGSLVTGQVMASAEIGGKRSNGVYLIDERWNESTHGFMTSMRGVHGRNWFFNEAAYPIYERNKPSFRTAVISSIDYEQAKTTVVYDPLNYTARNGTDVSLNGNFSTNALFLSQALLNCAMGGDGVVIRFDGVTIPVVVGFTDEDKSCAGYDICSLYGGQIYRWSESLGWVVRHTDGPPPSEWGDIYGAATSKDTILFFTDDECWAQAYRLGTWNKIYFNDIGGDPASFRRPVKVGNQVIFHDHSYYTYYELTWYEQVYVGTESPIGSVPEEIGYTYYTVIDSGTQCSVQSYTAFNTEPHIPVGWSSRFYFVDPDDLEAILNCANGSTRVVPYQTNVLPPELHDYWVENPVEDRVKPRHTADGIASRDKWTWTFIDRWSASFEMTPPFHYRIGGYTSIQYRNRHGLIETSTISVKESDVSIKPITNTDYSDTHFTGYFTYTRNMALALGYSLIIRYQNSDDYANYRNQEFYVFLNGNPVQSFSVPDDNRITDVSSAARNDGTLISLLVIRSENYVRKVEVLFIGGGSVSTKLATYSTSSPLNTIGAGFDYGGQTVFMLYDQSGLYKIVFVSPENKVEVKPFPFTMYSDKHSRWSDTDATVFSQYQSKLAVFCEYGVYVTSDYGDSWTLLPDSALPKGRSNLFLLEKQN